MNMNWETMYNKINNLINHMNQDTVILMKNTSRQLNNNVVNYLGYNGLNANTILGETQYYWLEYRNLTLKKIENEMLEFLICVKQQIRRASQSEDYKHMAFRIENDYIRMTNTFRIFETCFDETKQMVLRKYYFNNDYNEEGRMAINQAFRKTYSQFIEEINQEIKTYHQELVRILTTYVKDLSLKNEIPRKNNQQTYNTIAYQYFNQIIKYGLTKNEKELNYIYSLWEKIDPNTKEEIYQYQIDDLLQYRYNFVAQYNLKNLHSFFIKHQLQDLAEAMEKISQKSSARNFQQDCWILLDKILQSSLYSKDFKALLSEWNYAPKDLKVQTLKMYEKAWIDKYHQLPSKTEELLKITSTYQRVKQLSFKEFAQLTTRVLKQIGEYKEEEKENKSL